ncbi:MAG: Sigma-70 region 2 [Frankiaceae bacterium]|jgi:hypothetical protein|nr:Sigma-70 region 2 [Frankiaceae bacterium]
MSRNDPAHAVDADAFFRSQWPATARRIAGALARHGVPASEREDVLQETALRLYRSWQTLDRARDVEPYARTVALNVWRDQVRRAAYASEVLGDVPERADDGDVVERTTFARLELARVRTALGRLRPTEQSVLRDAVETADAASSVVPASLRMARMRARRQLVAVLRTASAWACAFTAATWRAGRPRRLTAAGVTTLAAFAVLLLSPHVSSPGSRDLVYGAGSSVPAAERVEARPATPAVRPVARARTAAAAVGPRRHRRAKPPAPEPMHLDLPGGSRVEIFAAVDVAGHGVQIRDRGGDVPVCVYGTGSPSPVAC